MDIVKMITVILSSGVTLAIVADFLRRRHTRARVISSAIYRAFSHAERLWGMAKGATLSLGSAPNATILASREPGKEAGQPDRKPLGAMLAATLDHQLLVLDANTYDILPKRARNSFARFRSAFVDFRRQLRPEFVTMDKVPPDAVTDIQRAMKCLTDAYVGLHKRAGSYCFEQITAPRDA